MSVKIQSCIKTTLEFKAGVETQLGGKVKMMQQKVYEHNKIEIFRSHNAPPPQSVLTLPIS